MLSVKLSDVRACIIAGGFGTRLRDVTGDRPKSLVDIDGSVYIKLLIDNISSYGINKFTFFLGYRATDIVNYLQSVVSATYPKLHFDFVVEDEPMGTAGSFLSWSSSSCSDDVTLVVYADTYFDIDLNGFLSYHLKHEAAMTLFVHPNNHPYDSDLVVMEDDYIVDVKTAPHKPNETYLPNLVNAALYFVNPFMLSHIYNSLSDKPCDFMADVVPSLLESASNVAGYKSVEYIKDIGTTDRLSQVQCDIRRGKVNALSSLTPRKAIFLDRDGVINELNGYVTCMKDLQVFEFSSDAIRKINDSGYLCIVITNQPVVARGDCDFACLEQIHSKLEHDLGIGGAYVDDIYYCPHHPDSGFSGENTELKINCECRKPGTLMYRQAAEKYNIDLQQSWVIGDSCADIMAASKLDVPSVYVRTGEDINFTGDSCKPTFELNDLFGAVNFITETVTKFSKFYDHLSDKINTSEVICVFGKSQVGKSTLSILLQRLINSSSKKTSHIINLDRFLLEKNLRYGIDNYLNRYDKKMMSEFMGQLITKSDIILPEVIFEKSDGTKEVFNKECYYASPDNIFILEGVLGGALKQDILSSGVDVISIKINQSSQTSNYYRLKRENTQRYINEDEMIDMLDADYIF